MNTKHGGLRAPELLELGLDLAGVLDLSANLNPYGPPATVIQAIREAPLDSYPDPDSLHARDSLARGLDLCPDRVVLGNGASELLWTLIATLALAGGSGSEAVVSTPAFGEIEAACEAFGVNVCRVHALENRDFAHDLATLCTEATRRRAALVYLCNPGTPTGSGAKHDELAAFATELASVPLVLDESFLSLSDLSTDARLPLPDNVIRVRSLTKEFAIPGVRIGYAIATPFLCRSVARKRPAWSVSAAAQAVAECASTHQGFVEESRAQLQEDRRALVAELTSLGFHPFESVAPYVAFPCSGSSAFRRRLLTRHGIGVRDCASFGLDNVIRIAVRPPEDRQRLICALRKEVGRPT